MQIHDYICFCVTHLLRARCDYECLNFGTAANFVYNFGRLLFLNLLYIFSVCNVNMSCIFSNLRFLKNGSVCALYELIITVRIAFF